ncbi:phosphoglycerate kinase [Vampirovibrio sp.]|uniref:phosphoglycerate kinase n=1 Tax=Vampirovibrio sp. TaxID=2717857 RepID=UPI00359469BA
MKKLTIQDIQDWAGKRALVREDFNVPLNDSLDITDDTRIREALPTLDYLTSRGAKVVIMSHLGRPKGKPSAEFSLGPVAKRLQELLPETKIVANTQSVSEEFEQIAQAIEAMPNGSILLLENMRFEPGEEKNDPELAQKLARFGDVYVNDAFGTAHRAHASTEGVAHHLKPKVAGLLMEREIKALSETLSSSEPLTAVIGGSKISTKITVLENLLDKVTHLVIGGGMLFTFLKAQGKPVGNSLVEDDYVAMAKTLLTKGGSKIVLAEDIVVADGFKADAKHQVVSADAIPDGWMGLDIGPKSIQRLTDILSESPVVLWNGPLGVFEFPAFEQGTRQVAETLAVCTESGKTRSILGGGDTVAAIEQFGIDPKRYTHVSTGGGASLEFLEGKTLPGIAVLDEATAPVH